MDRQVQGPLRLRIRGDARADARAPEASSGIVPHDTELPPLNPIGTPETRNRAGRQAVPGGRHHPPMGHAVGRRAAAVLAHGRGVRRVPLAHRRPDRPPARIPRGDRPAREHDDRAGLRQRRQRRGRSERLGQREQVLQRRAGRHRGEPRAARRSRQPADLQPLPERVGDGVQHAVQDVEALRVQRRQQRPVHHLLAQGDHRQGRGPRPVPPRDRHRPHGPRLPRRRAAGDDQGPRPERLRRDQHALQLQRRRRPGTPPDSVLLDARVAGDLARRVEGRQHPSDDQRLEPLQRRHVGALQRRGRPCRAARPRGRASGQGARAGEPVVPRGGRQRRVPARRPLSGRDHQHPASPAHSSRATDTCTTPAPPVSPRRRR